MNFFFHLQQDAKQEKPFPQDVERNETTEVKCFLIAERERERERERDFPKKVDTTDRPRSRPC